MVSGLGHFVTFLKTKTYSIYIFKKKYINIRSSWTMERDLKQLSRALHGINCAVLIYYYFFLRETQRI